jgi:hypothetical protein
MSKRTNRRISLHFAARFFAHIRYLCLSNLTISVVTRAAHSKTAMILNAKSVSTPTRGFRNQSSMECESMKMETQV